MTPRQTAPTARLAREDTLVVVVEATVVVVVVEGPGAVVGLSVESPPQAAANNRQNHQRATLRSSLNHCLKHESTLPIDSVPDREER